MQHAIGDHALLADGRTAALIDPDGGVAWLCWPRIDSAPLFFSILDDLRGGGYTVRPAEPGARVVARRYHDRSLVLETTWSADGARLVADDALSWDGGPLLLRRLVAVGGPVEVVATVRTPTWTSSGSTGLRLAGDVLELDPAGVAIRAPAAWTGIPGGAVCHVRVDPGSPLTLSATTTGSDPGNGAGPGIEATLAAWRRMLPAQPPPPAIAASLPIAENEVRALLSTTSAVLVGLLQRGGGIVAAPTTSLPQWPGAARNWDYRYCWLRDAALAGMAMLTLGLDGAALGLGDFIGAVAAEHGPVALVRVDGTEPPVEEDRYDLTGHGGARPVRTGNDAARQAQLDVPGEVLELAAGLAAAGELPASLRLAAGRLAGWVTEHWREPDHGIWEIRGAPRRYTHSLLSARAGLLAAARLAGAGLIVGPDDTWRAVAGAIAAEVTTPGTGALQLRVDGGGADAALALLPHLDLLEPEDPRLAATLDAIVAKLDRNGLLDRHEGSADLLDDPCSPFVFPTFWLAGALRATGRDGSRPLAAALATRSPLGLYGEVADPATRTPRGNFPQVQSHAAFALAVTRP